MGWTKLLIQLAYGVEDYQVTGGPGWLTSDRYEVDARAENPQAGRNAILAMLRTLLADRFQSKIRREEREMPVYFLVVNKVINQLSAGALSM